MGKCIGLAVRRPQRGIRDGSSERCGLAALTGRGDVGSAHFVCLWWRRVRGSVGRVVGAMD